MAVDDELTWLPSVGRTPRLPPPVNRSRFVASVAVNNPAALTWLPVLVPRARARPYTVRLPITVAAQLFDAGQLAWAPIVRPPARPRRVGQPPRTVLDPFPIENPAEPFDPSEKLSFLPWVTPRQFRQTRWTRRDPVPVVFEIYDPSVFPWAVQRATQAYPPQRARLPQRQGFLAAPFTAAIFDGSLFLAAVQPSRVPAARRFTPEFVMVDPTSLLLPSPPVEALKPVRRLLTLGVGI